MNHSGSMPTSRKGFSFARILLAEDDESSRKVTSIMLKRLGYNADVVTNGKEVLMALEHQSYDIILMNIRMPGLDGFEATRMIRERCPASMQPKIIAVTAYILPDSRERCLEAGMNDFMPKPVKMNDLASMLSKHIRTLELQTAFAQSRETEFDALCPFSKDRLVSSILNQDYQMKN